MNVTLKKGIYISIAILVVSSLLAVGFLLLGFSSSAIAKGETKYSDALVDLSKDSTFDPSIWNEVTSSYDMQLVTIAEGVDNQLFVYVYQPGCANMPLFEASYIRLSETIDDSIAPRDYKLVYLNHSGVFFKYAVEGITVKSDAVRYYAVIQLMRPFVAAVDSQENIVVDEDFIGPVVTPGSVDVSDQELESLIAAGWVPSSSSNINVVNHVAFPVNRQYKFSTINGHLSVAAVDIETVTITDKYVGFVRMVNDPFFMVGTACDSHFVAFNTDHEIDDLLEADVEYYTQHITLEKVSAWDYILGGYTFVYNPDNPEDQDPIVLTLTDDQVGTFDAKGLFTAKQRYEWKRISTVEEFIESVDLDDVYESGVWSTSTMVHLTDESRAAIEDKQWVLRFVETPYQNAQGMNGVSTFERTAICNVTILRLKFRTNGVVYNLGVVDNMQSQSDPVENPDPNPDTVTEQETALRDPSAVASGFFEELEETFDRYANIFKTVLAVAALVLLLVLLYPILPYIIKAVIWIVSLPFKAIGAIVKASRKRKKEKQQKGASE